MRSLKLLLTGSKMKITEAQETFLDLKWGEDYFPKMLDAWHTEEEKKFSVLEKALVLEWHMKTAGVKR